MDKLPFDPDWPKDIDELYTLLYKQKCDYLKHQEDAFGVGYIHGLNFALNAVNQLNKNMEKNKG